MALSCRYYEQMVPKEGELVMVKIQSISDMGVTVLLLEYDEIEGTIGLNELSNKLIRSINKFIRIGTTECVVVTKIDEYKNYIDLSKKKVSDSDRKAHEKQYHKAKRVNSILVHVAKTLNYDKPQLEELYKRTAWNFDANCGSFEAFNRAVDDSNILNECEIDDSARCVLLDTIRNRLTAHLLNIRAEIEITCFISGIEAIQQALREGLKLSTSDHPFHINLIYSPVYAFSIQTYDRLDGIERINRAIEVVKTTIELAGGNLSIKSAPSVVSSIDSSAQDD